MSHSYVSRDDTSTKEAYQGGPRVSTRRRILVLEHDDQIRNLVCTHLIAIGFEVASEDNGMSGLSRMACDWEAHQIHGLLMELQLPVLGGLAILQEMNERFPEIPVIAMSDSAHVGKLRQAMKLGAREYLIKPFDPELFRHKCQSVFLGEPALPR